ncbi:MAG: hypothetical protein EA397_00740 [Deltaproteobacteria bacterium]|nr:MAG: hypothetical protein EA397_00740 [Deltaproteobacteria bacterium]
MIAELHANPSLEVVDVAQRELTEAQLVKLESKYGPLPEAFRALLLDVGRVWVKWRSWADPDVGGEVQLDAFGTSGKIRVAKHLFFVPDKGHFALVGPMAKPGGTKARKTTRKLVATFEEAFDLMLRARGFHGWPQAYFGQWIGADSAAQCSRPRSGLLQAALPALFPDFDLKAFGQAAKVPPATDLPPLDQQAFDLSPERAGLSFAARLQRQLQLACQAPTMRIFDVQFNPPATQDEIDAAQEATDFELSESFLNYFRSCNGFRFSTVEVAFSAQDREFDDDALRELWRTYCESGGRFGSVEIPPIQKIFTKRPMPPLESPEDRFFASIDRPLPDGHSANAWHMLCIDLTLSQAHPNPVVRMTEDYGADTRSRLPVDAATYLEWLLITLGNYHYHKELFPDRTAVVNGLRSRGIGRKHPAFVHPDPSAGWPIREATAEALGAFRGVHDPFFSGDPRFRADDLWDAVKIAGALTGVEVDDLALGT